MRREVTTGGGARMPLGRDRRTIEVADGTVVIRTETKGVKQERIVHVDQGAHPAGFEPTTQADDAI